MSCLPKLPRQLNPTPQSLMGNFNTHQPDVTESLLRTDAGHFQAEFSFAEVHV
jgi:hypothetical protein